MAANQDEPLTRREGQFHADKLAHEGKMIMSLMENMRLIAVILDSQARITFCNDHLLKLTGWEKSEILGKNWFKIFVRDLDPAIHKIFINSFTSKSIIPNYENPIYTKSGEKLLVEWNNSLLLDEHGNVIGTASVGEDVTQKRAAELALRQTSERLNVFFHQSLDGFFFCHFDHPREWKHAANKDEVLEEIIHTQRFSDVNEAMLRQYNISREDFLKLTTKDVFAHDMEQGRKLRRELFDNGHLHLETYERKTDGTPVWFEGDYVCLYDEQERITGFFGIQREITDRKQSEIALRESEERYRTLFSNMLDGMYRSTPDGKFVDVNPAMVSMFGYDSKEEMLQADIKKDLYYSPEERKSLFLNTGAEKVNIFRMKRKDGSEIWVEDHGRYVHDEQGNVIFYEGILRDVTDRVHAEAAILAAEEKYRSIFENAVEGIYQSSPLGHFITVNPSFARMLGYATPEQLIASVTDIARQIYLDASRREDFMNQMESKGSVADFEYQMRRRDGGLIWVSENARVVHDKEGGVLYYEGIVEDITARKNAEQALMESEWRNRAVAEMTTDYAFIIDVDSRGTLSLRWVSENIMRFFGYDSAIKKNIFLWKKILHPEDTHIFLNFVRRLLESGEEQSVECRTAAANKEEPGWFEISAKPLKDENGVITTIIGAIKDITERKRVQKQLLLQSAALNAAANAMVITDNQGNIEWINPAYSQISGYAADQIIGKTPRVVKSGIHDDAFYKDMWDTILRGEVWRGELTNRRSDGSLYVVDETITPIFTSGSTPSHFIGITQDISERKENEQRIQKQIQRLNALHAIDNAINSSTDLRTTLDVLLKEALAQLKSDAAAVALFDKTTLALDYKSSRGFLSKSLQNIKLVIGKGLAGRVVLERKPLHIPDLRAAQDLPPKEFLFDLEKFIGYIGVPLIVKGQILGVLEIFHRAPLNPDAEWLDFLNMLAGQTAIAVDNAQMFENLQRSNFELTLAYDATIEGWSRALDLRDRETEGHTQRVTALTLQLAKQMGISDADMLHIRRGAMLHDIGKMGIPDSILHKTSSLTEEEWGIMRQHTIYATEMLSPILYLRPALDIPRFHHEKWDGSGYPYGLRGTQIPLAARIFAVVDVWDAVTSDRPYRAAWSKKKAIQYIKSESGKLFDPDVVSAFLSLIGQDKK